MSNQSIPVLYYHRVGAPDPAHLSVSLENFERQLAYLQRSGFRTITVRELIDYLNGDCALDCPAVCITFDDGLLDNLLYAHPILQKYNMKAALFIATSLIRPITQAAADKMVDFNTAHTLARLGDFRHFLSTEELKQMHDSGVWEIYSHSHQHNQVFTSTEQTGVYPDNDNHWGIISAYRQDISKKSWPVYRRGAGLVNKAVIPVPKDDKTEFHQETESEFAARVEEDLQRSLEIIQQLFPDNYPVICWPWGKADENLEEIAKKTGYIAALRTDTGANVPGMNLMRIHRFPVKKPDLIRFRIGIMLRKNPLLAKIYSFLRN
jgi:peptidoglycan/xylan/chitin deacetylase (PgdA/CDA1 family)